MITFINRYLGWRNWAVIRYNSIFENLFVIFYIALHLQDFSNAFLTDIFLFLLFSVFSTTYGYLINDYADMELDKAHGKPNTFSSDSSAKALLICMLFLVLSVFFGLPFSDNAAFALLWLAWIVISTFYSLPPMRLKERGLTGIVFVIAAQRVIPIFLVFAAFNFPVGGELLLLAIYVLMRGASSDINHQLEDLNNDIKTGTRTFAVSVGASRTASALKFTLSAERWLLAILLVLFLVRLTFLDIIPAALLYLNAALYFWMLVRALILRFGEQAIDTNPFRPGASNVFQFLHHSFPSVILAASLNIMLIYYNWRYVLLFAVIAMLRGLFNPSTIKNSFVYKEIKGLFS